MSLQALHYRDVLNIKVFEQIYKIFLTRMIKNSLYLNVFVTYAQYSSKTKQNITSLNFILV